MRTVLVSLLLLLALAAIVVAQGVDRPVDAFDLAYWPVSTPPEPGTSRWLEANHSNISWKVSVSGGRVVVSFSDSTSTHAPLPFEIQREPDMHGFGGHRYVAKVDDGWIVGFNHGEWGGSLWWFDLAGKRNYKISDDQVNAFIDTEYGFVALEGLCHMGLNRGQLLRLGRGSDLRWTPTTRVDLVYAPETALLADDGSILVATTDQLVRVLRDNTTEVLIEHAFWGGLYPNSIVRDPRGTYYLGMRHGVARIVVRKSAYAIEWLVPKSIPALAAPTPN